MKDNKTLFTDDDDMILFLDTHKRPTELYLSHLLGLNFAYHDNKEENVKDLNDLIQTLEKCLKLHVFLNICSLAHEHMFIGGGNLCSMALEHIFIFLHPFCCA